MLQLVEQLGAVTGARTGMADLHRFPDGEGLVTLPGIFEGEDIAIVATLRDPDLLALHLRFAASTARELGARRVGLIAPYLAYMRQDRRFAPGQALNAKLFAVFLEESFDWLVTADPHLHRTARLADLFTIPATRVETAPLLAQWIAAEAPDAVLIGPDAESQQWVGEVAKLARRPFEVLTKHRGGDRQIELSSPAGPALSNGTPVVVDDIASSGKTMAQTVRRLLEAGTRAPVCLAIHAVFAEGAETEILSAGAARIVTTDSIPHPTNAISIAAVLAGACRAHLTGSHSLRRWSEDCRHG
jgi:ribose-phosphate pyrophosphokinase